MATSKKRDRVLCINTERVLHDERNNLRELPKRLHHNDIECIYYGSRSSYDVNLAVHQRTAQFRHEAPKPVRNPDKMAFINEAHKEGTHLIKESEVQL